MSRGTVLLIAGSRDWEVCEDEIEAALAKVGLESTDIGLVVTGGARGADRGGKEWAEKWGYAHREFKAKWRWLGKAAGPARNKEMADFLSNGDKSPYALLFWDGTSPGTKDMIARLVDHWIAHRVFNKQELALAISGAH